MKSLVFILGCAVGLAACGAGSDVTETTGTPSSATTSTAPAVATTALASASTSSTAAGEAASGDENCLVGEWELDSQAFFDSLFAIFGGQLGMEEASFEHVSGSYIVSLDQAGNFEGDRQEWTFRFSLPEGGFRTTIDGLDSGTYEVEGGTISVSAVDSTASVKFQAEADGELLDLPFGPPQQVQTDVFSGAANYSCTGDVLTITTEEGITSVFTRLS